MSESYLPVVLVHGAWHGGWCFTKVVNALHELGVPVFAPDLPGHGSDPGAFGDLAADAARVRLLLDDIDGPVVLLGHSYGGLVISEAASDPTIAARIRRLVYLCATVTEPGKTFFDVPADNSRSLLRPLIVMADGGLSTIDVSDRAAIKAAFFADCSDADVSYAVKNLGKQPMSNLGCAVSGDPLATIPATYMRCTQDRVIPIEVQDALIASASPTALALEIVTLASSHSAFLSRPSELADQLATLARR